MKILLTLTIFFFGIATNVFAYQTSKVSFTSNGNKLAGTLYLPDGYKKGQKVPAVVVTGAWTTVKEQMPKTYAVELAKKGYAALVFDFSGWGESEGKNRYLEDPETKTKDIVRAVEFLASRSEVNSGRIGGVGICASSGYMADAYTRTSKLKSIALVAPWLHNPEIATNVYGGPDSVKKLLSSSDSAEQQFKKTGKLTVAVAASSTDKNSIMYQAPYYTEKNRGLIKEYDNKFNLASWRGWLTYDAMTSANKLPGKVLFVGSDAMALPQGAKEYQKQAKDKIETVWLENVNQFDFYDKKGPVSKAIEGADKHFTKYLK